MSQTDLFLDVKAMQRRQQFRMRRLQVFNWGTFSGLHDIPIAENGFLFVGRSGSGKSTLLDALSALLIPPQWLTFNAAAREGDRNRRDRNLVSYVRGAWGDQKDSDSGEIATRHLRTGTTWSALALSFANAEGREVTLVQLYWLRGTSVANPDVHRHYMVAERAFDIARELEGFDLDVRSLKSRLTDLDHFGNVFRPYSERFRRLLGIESEMALKLLHKTQSAKNLGDLNSFLREFMLDEPESFAAADRLINEFAELDAAHQEVVTARRQVETLQPAREQYETMQTLEGQLLEQRGLIAAMDGHAERLRSELLAQAIEELATRDQGLAGIEQQQTENLRTQQSLLEGLQAQHRERGGDRIESLERERQEAESQRDQRVRRRQQVEQSCRTLGWGVPDNAHVFSERVAEARAIVEKWRGGLEDAESRRDALRDQKGRLEQEFTTVVREVQAMERQPSNIPAHMLDLRRQIATAVGYAETELPFVGELIQVKEEAAEWRGAIERVLHGFALALLVDRQRYAAVSAYINDTHLGTKVVYYLVGDEVSTGAVQPRLNSLLHKLELKETTLRPWLESELLRRFDYACVESMQEFRREPKAITRQGQVRHGRDRHEKDDRWSVDDRKRWVLGFDNAEKLALYRQQAQRLGAAIADLDRQMNQLKEERAALQGRVEAAMLFTNLEWQEIDVASILDRLGVIAAQLRELQEGNRDLRDLGQRIEVQREQVDKTAKALEDTVVERRMLAKDRHQREQEQIDCRKKLASLLLPNPEQAQRLRERFDAKGAPTLRSLDERRREVERTFRDELSSLEARRSECVKHIERAFADFKREWPAEGADMEATVAAAPEFTALLQRLEHDGLPRHEQRFFDMLKEQSSENLAALNAHLLQARKDIYARMELVNEGLADAEFNPGTHLQIDISDRHLEDVRQFREQVQQVLGHAWQMDRASAEERFLTLRQLVRRLASEESEHRRWREQVLDVRLHVEFIGRELDGQGNEVEIYRSGAGKSGGQREKLATTCLAAALRYQLGGADGGLPLYAPVVLDEAFGKADNEFTELAMRIFEKFGFQMIVATPLKSVMTLEPFIGGACFVDIADRKRSATLPIDYDTRTQRLNLPEHVHGQVSTA